MDWKELDLSKRNFMADGNGYTLTSNTDMRGSGIVFQFTASGRHDTVPILAPSENVDKTIFGIIPGCKQLVSRDFPLIGEDRREDFLRLFEDIGIDRRLSKRIANGYRDEPRRDAMILLCSFIPLENCPILFNYLPGFRRRAPWTPLHSSSGRAAFLELLEDRVKNLKRKYETQADVQMDDREVQADLQTCLQKLQELLEEWRDDFLCNWKLSVIQGSKGDKKVEFSNACRKVFDLATKMLKKTWSTGDSEKNQYIDLVAAHCIMAFHTIENAAEKQDTNADQWRESYEANRELRNTHKKRFGAEVGKEWLYRLAESYVASINNGNHSVVKNLRAKGCSLSEDNIEAAWWTMMARGIAWDMSTTGGPLVRDRQHKQYHWNADYVPSKFYDIGTPVWIS
ncbi:hypothetical protein BKA66DRAFT_440080 [Pyrenochaeta sp. MPI-SDFR-AT-0127]|nr:hypothetical protein BKA66DRAFT_440080 [Pyrenochaeta sp. MPI-SDFR-AT-0127]